MNANMKTRNGVYNTVIIEKQKAVRFDVEVGWPDVSIIRHTQSPRTIPVYIKGVSANVNQNLSERTTNRTESKLGTMLLSALYDLSNEVRSGFNSVFT